LPLALAEAPIRKHRSTMKSPLTSRTVKVGHEILPTGFLAATAAV